MAGEHRQLRMLFHIPQVHRAVLVTGCSIRPIVENLDIENGTCARMKLERVAGGADLVKLAEEERVNEREEKVRAIAMHIGQRPVLAFGNADRDLAMLHYVAAGCGPRLAMLLRHDDGVREFAYDHGFSLNPLDEALERAEEIGLQVVSMRQDWHSVFPATSV